jgi:hypothetical protein
VGTLTAGAARQGQKEGGKKGRESLTCAKDKACCTFAFFTAMIKIASENGLL